MKGIMLANGTNLGVAALPAAIVAPRTRLGGAR